MATRKHRSEKHAALCADYAARLLPGLRDRACELGYAIGVHGSLVFDIDLIACPWTSKAVVARHLADAIRAKAEEVLGIAFALPEESGEYFLRGSPGAKPHGRLVWSFHLGGGPYIDLSVMPRLEEQRMHINIFAYTAPGGSYPEYLSFNEQGDGMITVSMRGPAQPANAERPYIDAGHSAEMKLPREQLPQLIADLQALVRQRHP